MFLGQRLDEVQILDAERVDPVELRPVVFLDGVEDGISRLEFVVIACAGVILDFLQKFRGDAVGEFLPFVFVKILGQIVCIRRGEGRILGWDKRIGVEVIAEFGVDGAKTIVFFGQHVGIVFLGLGQIGDDFFFFGGCLIGESVDGAGAHDSVVFDKSGDVGFGMDWTSVFRSS